MKKEILETARQFHADQDGATATEYIVLLVLVACFVIGAVKALGGTLSDKYDEANNALLDEVTLGD